MHFNLSSKSPSHVTILNWTKKFGCYQMQKTIEKSNDWIIIIDESIEFGHDKLFVVYGIRSSKIDFSRALNYKDLTPLLVKAKSSWTGDLMKMELDKIKKLTGGFLYAVADGGNAILRCLRLCNITHIYDITHKIAWILKQIYKENPDFISYTKEMAKMRTKLVLSDVSHILPPNQRTDSRFMNLDILSAWGTKVLSFLQKQETQTKEYKKLKWVEKYTELIKELSQVNDVISEVKHELKTKGLASDSKLKALEFLEKITIENQRTQYLKSEVINYLSKYQSAMDVNAKLLCTSDIIESSFGKYKSYINNNPMIGITNLSLSLAAFTGEIDEVEVKKALEAVTIFNLEKWSKENIGNTNMSKRKNIFQKNKGEKILSVFEQN